MTKTRADVLDYCVYNPEDGTGRHADMQHADMQRCRFRILPPRIWHFCQCSRGYPPVEIDGYRFCTQHAKIVQKRIDRIEQDTKGKA